MSNPALDASPGSLQAAARRRTARRLVGPYLVVQLVLLVVYCTSHLVLDDGLVDEVRVLDFVLTRLVGVVAVVIGARAARRAVRREWGLVLAAALVWFVADTTIAVLVDTDGAFTFWLPPGVLSLGGYVLMGWAMVRLARIEGLRRGAAVWLESAVASLSYVMVWWVVVGHELTHRTDFGVETALSNLYPLGDVVIIGGGVALLGSRSGRGPSARLLVAACTAGVIGDLGFGMFIADTSRWWAAAVPAVWLVQYGLLGLAALLSHHAYEVSEVEGVTPASVLTLVGATCTPSLLVGVLASRRGQAPDGDLMGTVAVATVVMVGLSAHRIRRLVQRIELQARELETTARTDELTQLPNRRAGVRLFEEAVAAVRDGADGCLGVAIIDLDHFKDYNDTHGHLQGDHLLRAAGVAWGAALAGRGTLYRHGGEEFVVLLPGCDVAAAEAVLEQMRRATPRGQSFSAGLALLEPGESGQQVLARADLSLYVAKAEGRGRTRVAA